MSELSVLQAIRLKGRIALADLAVTIGEDPATIETTIVELTDAGLVAERRALQLTPAGRARLGELLAQERAAVDTAALAAAHDDFLPVNAELKTLVTTWQLLRDDPDAGVSATADVSARLADIHASGVSIIATASTEIPRLAAYAVKLDEALRKIAGGDMTWLTNPMVDSYHTVWFELHEELIGAAGLTRD